MGYSDYILECEWKKHPYLDNILVSDNGRVLSYRKNKWIELKSSRNIKKNGYYHVEVVGKKHASIHRLVAETFIDNPYNKPQVNHKDGNRLNNHVNNLEWCTQSENQQHATRHGLRSDNVPVIIIETGEKFNSLSECARAINGTHGHISKCLSKKEKTYKGYHFDRVKKEVV